MLQDYFEEKNEKKFLIDCTNATKSGDELTDEQKCKCVKLVANFAVDTFGMDINVNEIKQMAFATISLIEGLRSKTGEPTVSWP